MIARLREWTVECTHIVPHMRTHNNRPNHPRPRSNERTSETDGRSAIGDLRATNDERRSPTGARGLPGAALHGPDTKPYRFPRRAALRRARAAPVPRGSLPPPEGCFGVASRGRAANAPWRAPSSAPHRALSPFPSTRMAFKTAAGRAARRRAAPPPPRPTTSGPAAGGGPVSCCAFRKRR